jgi:hypothetical protein
VFQNASFDNREWLTYYEKIFASMERSARDLTMTLPSLDRLPTYFYQLAGTDTFDSLTDAQISHGISQYMSVLQETLRDLSPSSAARSAAAETVRAALLTSVDNLGRELTTRSSEANGQFRDLEKSIAAAAKSVYGHKVGAESFNYLLIVFALVFLVLMVMPRFYPEIVAVNILKSEFLLQFSTVFVLVAAIIILAIGELIAKDQLPVLLAGISGYVLGQLGKSSGSIAPENDRRGVREGATS